MRWFVSDALMVFRVFWAHTECSCARTAHTSRGSPAQGYPASSAALTPPLVAALCRPAACASSLLTASWLGLCPVVQMSRPAPLSGPSGRPRIRLSERQGVVVGGGCGMDGGGGRCKGHEVGVPQPVVLVDIHVAEAQALHTLRCIVDIVLLPSLSTTKPRCLQPLLRTVQLLPLAEVVLLLLHKLWPQCVGVARGAEVHRVFPEESGTVQHGPRGVGWIAIAIWKQLVWSPPKCWNTYNLLFFAKVDSMSVPSIRPFGLRRPARPRKAPSPPEHRARSCFVRLAGRGRKPFQ